MKKLLILVLLALLALLSVSGCNTPSIIDGVGFNVEPNIETVKVQLNFAKDVQSDLGGTFDVKSGNTDYGQIEIQPTSAQSPFNVGFRLNLAIVNDQDYASLKPVQDLPSGQPLPMPGLNRALARVALKNPLNPNFDIYAYVDVVGKEWIGLALTLKFINTRFFPAGLSFSQGFVKGKDSNNRIYGSVFGPKVDASGIMIAPGGIALFANAKGLLSDAGVAQLEGVEKGGKFYLFQGPQADYYNSNAKAAAVVTRAFKELLRANSFGNQLL